MYRILTIIIVFLIGFAIGTIGKIGYEKLSDKPYEWYDTPIIVNCYGNDFSELNLIKAIDYWAVRGESISFYEMNPSDRICDNSTSIDGFIILRKAKKNQLKDTTLAVTKRRTTFDKLLSAEITFSPGAYNLDLLIEHELGHAFGFNHINIDNHIMHPIYNNIGQDFFLP